VLAEQQIRWEHSSLRSYAPRFDQRGHSATPQLEFRLST
jgi:hypothetical protein